MTRLRIVIASSGAVLLMVASVAVPRILTLQLASAMRPAQVVRPAAPRLDRGDRVRRLQPSVDSFDDAPRRMDLRGNEIARPVARYRVDRRGTLYEIHSPHTEVPRLKAPTL